VVTIDTEMPRDTRIERCWSDLDTPETIGPGIMVTVSADHLGLCWHRSVESRTMAWLFIKLGTLIAIAALTTLRQRDVRARRRQGFC
jgi:hypothetical protein